MPLIYGIVLVFLRLKNAHCTYHKIFCAENERRRKKSSLNVQNCKSTVLLKMYDTVAFIENYFVKNNNNSLLDCYST